MCAMISLCLMEKYIFFFNDTATTEIYTLSLHDALPICECEQARDFGFDGKTLVHPSQVDPCNEVFSPGAEEIAEDRKSTRLNSSHANISYAVFCLQKNKLTKP